MPAWIPEEEDTGTEVAELEEKGVFEPVEEEEVVEVRGLNWVVTGACTVPNFGSRASPPALTGGGGAEPGGTNTGVALGGVSLEEEPRPESEAIKCSVTWAFAAWEVSLTCGDGAGS